MILIAHRLSLPVLVLAAAGVVATLFMRNSASIPARSVVVATARTANTPNAQRTGRESRSERNGDDSLDLLLLAPRADKREIKDPFGTLNDRASSVLQPTSVAHPPPPPPPPALDAMGPAISPTAPSLPFVYLGRMNDGVEKVFLSKGDSDYALRVSDVLEDAYRVEKIEEQSIVFTYLPLNERQTLSISSAP